MKLSEAPSDRKMLVTEILSGKSAKRRMSAMGLHIDDIVIRSGNGKWGPVLVQNISTNSSKIALGREIANDIIVELTDDDK